MGSTSEVVVVSSCAYAAVVTNVMIKAANILLNMVFALYDIGILFIKKEVYIHA
jgi:hypothetical protein